MFVRAILLSLVIAVVSLASGTSAYSGDGTWYETGLGACGIYNTDSDKIVAASARLFDTYPGATANPNNNPICKRRVNIHYQGKTVQAAITDRCAGCAGEYDLDMSPGAFDVLAPPSAGRIPITWEYA
ncbi:hypothetical protein PLICRDRAFT_179759 [Plicaturopsis crispa FD-325 SS-3]|uniref:RlpA-like protein double-psi beta-barrel domain-containing protein n=1 Tax=Plicaturopsis crispa FD-325 SS-3 TaxID=944288 RepID=A0A0C9SQU8_PLICR|nr:hypothetical protein PLICRDRAFT_179759 [Plicaturopsis crispa FD-325 SS-3]